MQKQVIGQKYPVTTFVFYKYTLKYNLKLERIELKMAQDRLIIFHFTQFFN